MGILTQISAIGLPPDILELKQDDFYNSVEAQLGMYQIRIRFEDSVSNLFGFGFDRTSVPIDSDSTETRFLEIRIRPRLGSDRLGFDRDSIDRDSDSTETRFLEIRIRPRFDS